MISNRLTRRMRTRVVPVSTLTRLNVFRALVSRITCFAEENFESNLFCFMLASTMYDITNSEIMRSYLAWHRDILSNALDTSCILTDGRNRVLTLLYLN